MHRHGGRFYDYPNEGITHYIATNLAYSKAIAFKNKLVVRPEWIVDWLALIPLPLIYLCSSSYNLNIFSIKEKRILSTDSYLVATFKTNQNKLNFTPKHSLSLAKNCISIIEIIHKIESIKKYSLNL